MVTKNIKNERMKDVKNASTRCFNSSTHKKKWPNNSIKQKKKMAKEKEKKHFLLWRGGGGGTVNVRTTLCTQQNTSTRTKWS